MQGERGCLSNRGVLDSRPDVLDLLYMVALYLLMTGYPPYVDRHAGKFWKRLTP